MGGANADSKADLEPLAGRVVILWPDADDPGRRAMRRIAQRLPQALQVIETEDLPEVYDAADLEASGCVDAAAWLNARLRNRTESDSGPWPDPVDFLGDGDVT